MSLTSTAARENENRVCSFAGIARHSQAPVRAYADSTRPLSGWPIPVRNAPSFAVFAVHDPHCRRDIITE
jgi:hypothetical protein